MNSRNRWFLAILVACPLATVLSVFLGHGIAHPLALLDPGSRGILAVRMSRVVVGALVGASLSVAGAVLQAVLRNPLAEPYVLGLTSGAGLGIALCIVTGAAAFGALALPAAGFVWAMISLAVVYQLARVGRATAPHTLVLAGVVWSSVCGSLLMFVVSQSSAEGLHAIMWWFLGDLQVFDPWLVRIAMVLAAAAFFGLSFLARGLNVLLLGEELAGHVGLRPERVKFSALALAAVLTAASVATSGLISFVGLTVPHAARGLVGPDHRRLLPAAALLGAAFLCVADGLGRTLFYPVEVPVGVITALVGGPFFFILLRRKQKEIWTS